MDLRRDRWTRSQPPSLDPGYFECDSLYRVSRLMVLHVGGVTLRAIPYKHAQSRDVPCFVTRGCKYTTTVCSTVTKFVSMFFCYLRLFVFVITLFFFYHSTYSVLDDVLNYSCPLILVAPVKETSICQNLDLDLSLKM